MLEELLELAIEYVISLQHRLGLDKARKHAVRRRAVIMTIENSKVFVDRRGQKVKLFWLTRSESCGLTIRIPHQATLGRQKLGNEHLSAFSGNVCQNKSTLQKQKVTLTNLGYLSCNFTTKQCACN